MMRVGDAVKAVQLFFDAYLVRRDITGTMACLTEGIQWVGTGISEIVCGREQAERSLKSEFSQSPEAYRIK